MSFSWSGVPAHYESVRMNVVAEMLKPSRTVVAIDLFTE